jgi:hypothetical protein
MSASCNRSGDIRPVVRAAAFRLLTFGAMQKTDLEFFAHELTSVLTT